MPQYQIYGKVTRTGDEGTRVVAEGASIKEADSAEALKAAWEADMRAAFRDGPHDTVEYFCRVSPLPVAQPPPPETEAGANAFDRPPGFPSALDIITAAPPRWLRSWSAWSFSKLLRRW